LEAAPTTRVSADELDRLRKGGAIGGYAEGGHVQGFAAGGEVTPAEFERYLSTLSDSERTSITAEVMAKKHPKESISGGLSADEIKKAVFDYMMSHEGYAAGGKVRFDHHIKTLMASGYASGGSIAPSDTVPAMLTPGEFVVKKAAVDKVGIDRLHRINDMRGYAEGGQVAVDSPHAINGSSPQTNAALEANTRALLQHAQALASHANALDSHAKAATAQATRPFVTQIDGREIASSVISQIQTAQRSAIR